METMKNENNALRMIMTTAWQFVKRNGYNLSKALKCAWANYRLQQSMKIGIVRFCFRKIDGTIREAVGTLLDNVVPTPKGSAQGKKTNDEIQVYFDTEKNEYRSFKKANLISIA